MNVSFAGIDPPLWNFGDTQTTRPTAWDTTLVLRSSVTVPVKRIVKVYVFAAGWTTRTAGLSDPAVVAAVAPRSTRSGARAKYRATTMAIRISPSWA